VAVVDSLLRNEQTTFSGASFQINGMPGFPRPAQDPRPPLMIGGTGKRMLSFAARNADIVGINLGALSDPTPEAMDERVGWIRAAAGERLDAIELNNIVGTLVVAEGDRREALRAELERMAAAGRDFINEGIDEEAVLASPTALIGSPGFLAEQLRDWRERWGISYVILPHAMMRAFAPVIERLA
jgi:alkanesulfonate monooxygenase SsuD/methylene tetrahydromethanopterin reductase-like flavin-dependent oxidoreductase (luciferase family)